MYTTESARKGERKLQPARKIRVALEAKARPLLKRGSRCLEMYIRTFKRPLRDR